MLRMVGFPFLSYLTGGIQPEGSPGGRFAFIVIYGFWEGFWIVWLYTRVVSVSVGSLWEPGGTFLASWAKGVRTGGRSAVKPLLSLSVDITSRFWVPLGKDVELETHGISIIWLTIGSTHASYLEASFGRDSSKLQCLVFICMHSCCIMECC